MPRVCTVCRHRERGAIDEALVAGPDSIRDVAGQFRLSKSAVDRHRRRHLLPPAVQGERTNVPPNGRRLPAQAAPLETTTLATSTPARDRRTRFVQEYLVDLNATQAAIRAGYSARSAHVTGARLLRDAKVAAATQAAMDQRAQRVGMTADEVLRELKMIGLSDVGHYEVGDPAEPVKVRDGAAPETRRAISSVKRRVRRVERHDGQTEEIEDVEFRLWNKPEALRLAGQHLKLWGDREQGGGGVEKVFFLPLVAVSVEEWQRQVAERKAVERRMLPPASE